MAACADSARLALEEQARAAPEDGQRRVLLGLALAYLGRKGEAEREGLRGVALVPISRDAYLGPYNQLQLVRIYLLTGEPDEALDRLEPLLRVPFSAFSTVAEGLACEPNWPSRISLNGVLSP